MNAPNRAVEVRQIVRPYVNWLRAGHREGDTDHRKRLLLPVICRQLNLIETSHLWGVLVKTDQRDFIPSDIIVWWVTLEHFDVLTDDGATWGVKGVAREAWKWRTSAGMPEPPDLTPEPVPKPAPSLNFPSREEMVVSGEWLHKYYQIPQGLQRPEGLWIDGHPDWLGIGAWLFDVYLKGRMLDGLSPIEARQRVISQIEQSDEWKQKHQT